MSSETGRPSQLKQRSRKGKKAWRKNIDLTEIDQQLEQKIENEIYVGQDEPEFSEDRAGSTEFLSKNMRAEKKLKSLEILHSRSEVPALVSKHKKQDKKRPKISKYQRQKLLERAGFTDKDKLKAEVEKDGILKVGQVVDLWSAGAPAPVKRAVKTEIPEAPIPGTPAVALPQSGQSYNPSLDDWKKTIISEHAKVIKDEEREAKANEQKARIEAIIFETESKMKENELAGLVDSDSESESDSDDESKAKKDKKAVIKLSVNPPASQIRKTRTQRNKEKRHKKFLRELAELKEKRKFLQALQAKITNPNQIQDEPAVKEPKKPKNLIRAHSRHPMVAEPLAVKLSDELDDSMRRLKPEGDLLRERIRSLQARGIIEARIPMKRPRRRTKTVEKWNYKHFA